MLRRCWGVIVLILGFWAITPSSAYAYIDPGSTNYILQLLLGSLLGAGLAIATFWRRIRTFLGRVFSRKEQ